MSPLPELKEPERETRLFLSRIWISVVAMCLGMLVIVLRLAQLQLVNHEHYTTLSQENRLKVVPIPPTRGLIYSRDGVLLADNRPSFSLEVVPEGIKNLDEQVAALRKLVRISDDEIDRFHDELKQKRRFDTVPVKAGLTEEEVAVFSVNRHRYPGFSIAGHLTRYYPLGEQTAHLVGYVGRISEDELKSIDPGNYAATTHIGKDGVEKSWEGVLHGQVGYQHVEVNAQGRVLRVVERKPPVSGSDLYLSLDTSLQKIAIEALGEEKGAIVAIEPSTGGVLAFVSNPSYDPNEFVNGISRALYASLRDAPARPLYNRALQGQYPPGSTIKPLMALAGLDYGLRTPGDHVFCPGWFALPGDDHHYRCWLKWGHGTVDLKRSIAESCDVYYYTLAKDLGIDRMSAFLGKFGLGRATGIDLPGEPNGLLPSREWKRRTRKLPWFPGETLINGIGQGFMLASPLQLAHVASIVANRGMVIVPHVVGQIEDPVSHSASQASIYEREKVQVRSPQYWNDIIEGMVEVVHGKTGTARRSGEGAPYRFAGKTGTAQLFGIAQDKTVKNEDVQKALRDHALFISFAPVGDPQIAVAIIVENGGSGSGTAAPIARKLFDHYLGAKGPNGDSSG